MSRLRTLGLGLALSLLPAGCLDHQTVPPLGEGPATVSVEVEAEAELTATLPTDLLPRADGSTWVLDGEGRILVLDADLKATGLLTPATESLRRASRLAPATDGGAWVVDPAGFLLHLDAAGALVEDHVLETADGEPVAPVAVLDRGKHLLVSDRQGRILRWTAGTDAAEPWSMVSDEEHPAAVATDLLALPGGGVLAADAVGGRLLPFSADGERGLPWGRYGHWVGAMAAPKALAAGPEGTVLVADSALDAVQLFDLEDGTALGAVAADGELLRPDHPLAVRRVGDRFLVLGTRPARVLAFSLDAGDVAAARQEAGLRRLRHRLLDAEDPQASAASAERCATCHDGLAEKRARVLLDGRDHHPVDVEPTSPLPDTFPLDADGMVTCGTCHSPHGTSHSGEVLTTPAGEEDESFLRVGLRDDALCTACHGDTAHVDALAVLGEDAGAHPVGPELRAALESRGESGEDTAALLGAVEGGCTDCHAVHGAAGPSLTRDPAAAELCTGCHDSQAQAATNHAVGVLAAAGAVHPRPDAHLAVGADGTLACASCHDLVGGGGGALLRAPDDGGLLCVACHEDRADLAAGAHSELTGTAGVPCLTCHDVHGVTQERTLLRSRPGSHPPVAGRGDPHACTSCHADGPGRTGHPVTGRALPAALSATVAAEHGGTLSCETCHDPHQPVVDGGPTCGDCHEAPASASERGGHGGLVCLDCHPVHETSPMAAAAGRAGDGACLSCHGAAASWRTEDGERPAVIAAELHPPLATPGGDRWAPLADLTLFDDAGVAVPSGEGGHLACASCHLVHGPEAGSSRDHLRRGGWQESCAACHGEDALLLYRRFHRQDPTGADR